MIIRVMMTITMKDRDLNLDDDRLPVIETIKTIKYKYRWNQRFFLEYISQQIFLIEKLGSGQLRKINSYNIYAWLKDFFSLNLEQNKYCTSIFNVKCCEKFCTMVISHSIYMTAEIKWVHYIFVWILRDIIQCRTH